MSQSDTEENLTDELGKSLDYEDRKIRTEKQQALFEILNDIMEISRGTRDKALTHKGKEGITTIKVSVELQTIPEEIQLAMKVDIRTWYDRIFRRGINPKDEILILTKTGYRMATPQTLSTHRYQTMGSKDSQTTKPRTVEYSSRSITTIRRFLEDFNRTLIAVLEK